MAPSSRLIAVLDATVLYAAPTREMLLRLALTGLFHAKWLEDIHSEWMRHLQINRPDIAPEKIQRIRHLMESLCMKRWLMTISASSQRLKTCPILMIVTFWLRRLLVKPMSLLPSNVRDFPSSVIRPYGIEARHPDDFVCQLLDRNDMIVCAVFQEQRAALKNPAHSVEDFLATLAKQELLRTVAVLQGLKQFL